MSNSTILILAALAWGSFSLIGVLASRRRGRRPAEGFALGLFLGPIGAMAAALLPTGRWWEDPIDSSNLADKKLAERSTGEMLVLASKYNTAFLILGLVTAMGIVLLGLFYMSQTTP